MALFDKPTTNVTTPANAEATAAVTATTAGTEGKTKKQLRREQKTANKNALFQAIKDGKDIATITELAKKVAPAFFGVASHGGGGFAAKEYTRAQEDLATLLAVKPAELTEAVIGKTFDEVAVFTALKYGRLEMRNLAKDLIKTPRNLSPIYVAFDASTGLYKVAGVGTQPKDWAGYVPAKAE